MLRVAVFIDAGYLWKQLNKALFPDDKQYSRSNVSLNYQAFHEILTEYVKSTFPGIPLLRCYWYDGALTNGNLSSDHIKVAELNDFKLRLGSRITEHSDGTTRQKGVDGLIIADLIGLAQNKVLSHALLVSGDGDMVPGVGVAQSLGVRIHLLSIHNEQATSPHLKREADFFESWGRDKVDQFAQPRSVPDTSAHQPIPYEEPEITSYIDTECKNKALVGVETSPSPSRPACPHVVLAEENVSVAEFFDSLTDDEKMSIRQTNVPYDIDKRLIRFGYENNKHKSLAESEKRSLRKKINELAQHYKQEKSRTPDNI